MQICFKQTKKNHKIEGLYPKSKESKKSGWLYRLRWKSLKKHLTGAVSRVCKKFSQELLIIASKAIKMELRIWVQKILKTALGDPDQL